MTATGFRRFVLRRMVDVSGISGTGIVAEGVQFSDGHCSIRWMTAKQSNAQYESVQHILDIHGHSGSTVVEWLDKA